MDRYIDGFESVALWHFFLVQRNRSMSKNALDLRVRVYTSMRT